MPLPIFNAEVWEKIEAGLNWWMNNTVDRIFDNMADYSDLRLLKRETENQQTKPKIEPKPFVPSGRGGIVVKTTPPTADNAPQFTPPPTIQAAGVWESLEAMNPLGLPSLWRWLENNSTGPVPWLTSQIRKRFKEVSPQEPTAESSFKFGRLLTGNMTLDRYEVTEWTHIVDPTELTQNHQESYEAYAAWLAYQAGGVPLPEEYKGDFYDQGALLWPLDQRDFSGGVTLLFGSRFLGDILANWWTGSLNYDAATLRGTTYYEVNVTRLKASWERNYSENPAEVDSQVGLDGLALSLANLILDHRVEMAADIAGPIPKPHIILENSHAAAAAIFLGKGSYPGLYPRSWCNKSPEEIRAEIDKERELLTKELGETTDKNIIAAYEARLRELATESAEIGNGLIQLNRVNNIPEHIQALSNCLAEVMGAYPFKILLEKGSFLRKKLIPLNLATMEDGDDVPIQYRIEELPDEQFSVPNMAEALAELTGMLLNLQGHQDLNMEFVQRISAELVALRATTAQTFDRTDAIMDFLGFDLSYVDEKMPISFTPNATGNEILNLLQGSLVKYKKPLFKANKHNSTLQVQLYHLLKGASIIKAVHFRPFATDNPLSSMFEDDNSEFGKYLKQLVNGLNKDSEATFKKSDGTEVTMGFDEFIDFVETGWSQFTIDPNDARKPYGKDYNKRPRIWDLSKGDS
jgi:hypothetical protein